VIDIQKYLTRQYSAQPCWDLVADFYATEFDGVAVDYAAETRSVRKMADDFRIALHNGKHGFTQSDSPANGCIVLLGKNEKMGIHHCGIYMDGSVLHATPEAVFFEPLSVVGDKFALVQFWAKGVVAA
jgi:hypothetical protein